MTTEVRGTPTPPPTMIPYGTFVARHDRQSRDAFLAAIKDPHLILWTPLNNGDDDAPTGQFMTIQLSPNQVTPPRKPSSGPHAKPGPQAVLPVVKRQDGNAFTMMITVGRAPNNDLVLPDKRVSKFHCYLRRIGSSWSASDANSTNGTRVDNVPVMQERSLMLRSGSQILLGDAVTLEFLEPADLYERVRSKS